MGVKTLKDELKKTTGTNDKSADVTVIACAQHTIRPSAIESVSDVIVPNNDLGNIQVVINTIGGQSHNQVFESVTEAETYRDDVLETMYDTIT